MKKIIGILLLIALLVFLGGPFYSGIKAQQKLQGFVAALNSYPGYRASWQEYDRGWFTTEAILSIGLDPAFLEMNAQADMPESLDIPLAVSLKHGPLLFDDMAAVGWFSWRTQLAGEAAAWLAEHVTATGPGPLYQGRGYIGLNGAVDFRDAVQAFTVQGEDGTNLVTSAGYVGAARIDSDRQLSYEGMIRETDFAAQDMWLAVGNTNITLDGDLSQLDWETFIYPSNFFMHTTSIKLESGAQRLEVVGLGVEGVVEVAEQADWFTAVVTASLGSLTTPELQVTNASTTFAYERISMLAYKAYMDAMEHYAEAQDPALEPGDFLTPTVVQDFISKNPAFALRNLNFSMPAGDLLANFNLRVESDPATAVQMTNPLMLLQAIKLDAYLELDRSLAKYFAQRFALAQLENAQSDGGASDADLEGQSEQQAEEILQMLTAQNFLVQDGDDLKATLQFVDGQLLLNGNAIPIPLGALLGAQQPQTQQQPQHQPQTQTPQQPQTQQAPQPQAPTQAPQ